MTANSFGIATNNALAVINEICNAIVLYVGPKYLHLPKVNQGKKYKTSEFETKFWEIQAFGCIDGTHIPLHDFLNTLTVISVTNNSIHLAYKLYAFIKVLLWMLNITGLVVFTAQIFFKLFYYKRLRCSDLPKIFQTIITVK